MMTNLRRMSVKFNLTVGDNVTFEHDGETHHGFISRITKRATVMANDPKGDYKDPQGNRYSKYYIPLPLLEVVKSL